MSKYIWIKGRRLYYYNTYDSWEEALKTAKYYQRKLTNHYFILPVEGFFYADKKYKLYMNKIISLT